jgi:hypothetical protein
VGETTNVRFKYRLTNAKSFVVLLSKSEGGGFIPQGVAVDKQDEWQETTRTFEIKVGLDTSPDRKPPAFDELIFQVPKGSELLVDDVLVYEPATPK